MKKTIRRLVSFLCMLCLLASIWLPLLPAAPAERASAAPASVSQKLTATDGSRYLVTLNYDTDADIPEGAELRVRELLPSDDGYADLLARSALLLGGGEERISFARALDISLLDPVTGEEYQPEGSVQVSIALLDTALEAYPGVEVLHFGDEVEIMDASVNGEAVEFETSGFSVYVVIGNEGGKIETPRVEFHFLDYVYTDNNDGSYTAGPYEFLNTGTDHSAAGGKRTNLQTSQILTSGEAMENVANPPNLITYDTDGKTVLSSKYFFGWYLVNEAAADSSTGKVTYTWDTEPEQIFLERNMTVSDVVWANDDHTAITSLVFKAPVGTWYMKETGNPDLTKYLDNDNIYQIVIEDADNVTIKLYNGTTTVDSPDIAAFGILNISQATRRVILRKADDGNGTTDPYQMLRGAHFRIFLPDLTEVEPKNGSSYYESNSSGIWFSGSLPYGKYYLVETLGPTRPSGYTENIGKVYAMEVKESGVTFDPNDVPNANLTGADEATIVSNFKTWYAESRTS